ncbi:MAG TPA: DUF4412 domain-containing protein [Clostridia bacterium]|nr:DUF4412 domain-containing protein [Clostridia bacterium]
MKRFVLLLVLAISTTAFAGVTFTSTSQTEQNGKTSKTRVKASVSGQNARIEFLENEDDPIFTPGRYLLSRDGGKTMYLVDPAQKTLSPIDFTEITKEMTATMQRLNVKASVGAPKMTKVLDLPGKPVAGLATRHYRYQTQYTTTLEVLGQKTGIETAVTDDLWTTKALVDPALGVWLRKEAVSTGDANADALLKSEMSKASGFPVKRVTVTTTSDDHGHKSTSTTSMEILEAQVTAVPASAFVTPADYRQVPLPVPDDADDEHESHTH